MRLPVLSVQLARSVHGAILLVNGRPSAPIQADHNRPGKHYLQSRSVISATLLLVRTISDRRIFAADARAATGRICAQMFQFWRRLTDDMMHHQVGQALVGNSPFREQSYHALKMTTACG
jgi:hypothetical protein